MGLMNIYNNARNPIDDINIINKILELYANGKSLYHNIVRVYNRVDSRKYSIPDYNELYAMLFNKWKQSVVSMTYEEYVNLCSKGVLKQDFKKLRSFLKTVPDVSTKEEADKILSIETKDKELQDAMYRYRYNSFGEASGWEHFYSRYIHAKKDKDEQIDHRLYLSVDSRGLFQVAKYFTEICEKENIPYYFKYDVGTSRDDSMVVYSSTKNLEKYIDILRTIKKEHPELEQFLNKPPVLSAPIDEWIGYGSEPVCTKENGDRYSFNSMREEIIENAISSVTGKWVNDHRNMNINFRGNKITFEEYIINCITDRQRIELNKKINYWESENIRVAKVKGKDFIPYVIEDMVGCTKADVTNPKFRDYLYNNLYSQKDRIMDTIISGNYKGTPDFKINGRNNKSIGVTGQDIKKTMCVIYTQISKFDPNYAKDIQTYIKEISVQYGVDPNNFSFDKKRVQDMMVYDKKVASQNQVQEDKKELNEMLKKEVVKPRNRWANETDEEYEKYLKEFYGGEGNRI